MSAEANESARELLIRAREGDAAAREKVIEDNLALVKYLVKRFTGRGVEFDDLYQWGCLGLVKAVDRFDPAYPVKFSTYAVPVIMGEIRRYLRDDGAVHVSRTIHDRARRVEAYMRRFEAENRRRPDVSEVAEALGMEVIPYRKDPERAIKADVLSLNCPLTEETKFIINSESITKMKYGVMIINTGRGKLIKTEDLINGLRSHQVGSAALDVYEEEADYFYEDRSDRMIDDDKLALLLMMPNVIVTSHQAFFTREATRNIAITTLQNIRDFEDGKELVNEVK